MRLYEKVKIKHFLVIAIIGFLFITVSCDLSKKCALFNIYNYSSYQVTELFIPSMSEQSDIDSMEPGSSGTLFYVWVESDKWYAQIGFKMNGEDWGTLSSDLINDDTPVRYKPYKQIRSGDIVTVKIYDDHWEW